ncbi:MAG: aldehyde dehydrogenase family protein, partial [Mesorhizobium sp.]
MTAAKLRVADVFEQIAVRNPYDGTVIGSVESTAANQIAALINRAKTGAVLSRALPRHQRATILE